MAELDSLDTVRYLAATVQSNGHSTGPMAAKADQVLVDLGRVLAFPTEATPPTIRRWGGERPSDAGVALARGLLKAAVRAGWSRVQAMVLERLCVLESMMRGG